jgi:hypothetical protein
MIFIIRTATAAAPPFDIKLTRQTPATVPNSANHRDHFCLADPEAATQAGWQVTPVHDGWYADDQGGGMAIWGQGMFWEVRDTPFTVHQACGPEAWPADKNPAPDTDLNVRQAIFRG